jgi:hypothetical protein
MNARHALCLAAVPLACIGFLAAARSDVRPVPKPDVDVTGAPKSCVPLSHIRETRVRDDWTIDFMDSGNTGYRNALTARCSGLKSNDAITYKTSLSQLCNTDIVYVLETAGGLHRGPSCSLGQFVPIRLKK